MEGDKEPVMDLDEIAATFAFGNDEPAEEKPAEPAPETSPASPAEPSQPAPVTPTPAEPPTPAASAPPAPLPGLDGAQTPAPQAPPAADPRDLQIASLQAQMEALTRTLQAAPQQPGLATTTETPEQEAARLVKPEECAYKLTIPDQVLAAVFSEDTAQASNGMHHLINNLAAVIHRNVLLQARRDLQAYKNDVESTQYTTQFEQQKQDAQADYYKTYPTHNEPVIKMIVAQEAQKLGNEFPQLPWGEQFKNALGARVNAQLAILRGGQPAPAPAPSAAPGMTPVAPKPASFLPVGPSSGIPRFENDQDIISSTFSFGS